MARANIPNISVGHINNNGSMHGNVEPNHQAYTVELRPPTPRDGTIKKGNVPEQRHTAPNPSAISIQNNLKIKVTLENFPSTSEPSKSPTLSVTGSPMSPVSPISPVADKIRTSSFRDINLSFDLSALTVSKNEKKKKLTISNLVEHLKYDRYKLNKFYIFLVNLIMPSISIFVVSFLAYHFKEPFIFPSLGPTIFLHFAIPDHPPSSPLNTIFGHLLGICVGYAALIITGLQDDPAVFVGGISFERMVCASLSIGVTCFLMIIFLLNHPPAAATALIVALGILKTFEQFKIMMLAVVIITIQSFIFNRIIRADAVYPFWTRNGDKILDHLKKLFRCRYIFNGRTRTCAFCKYDRSDMKFVHVLLINLLCPAAGLFIIGIIGYYTNLPMLFPSIGPTAFVQFSIFQEAPASPKNTLISHFVAILFAYLGLLIFGLTDNPGVAVEGISIPRIGSIVFALGFTCVLMVLFKIGHPPAAATTLIVAMGILKEYIDLAVLMGAVVIFTIFTFITNRILRKDAIYPIWGKIKDEDDVTHEILRRQDSMHGVLEEELGYHHFPSL